MTIAVRARLGSERGAILIQVALMLLVLTAISGFAIDYGMQLVSRGQIQNAVDSAALAGATALSYDSYTDRSAGGPAHTTAEAVAANNLVWSDPATVVVDPEVTCASTYEPGASGTPILACVQVTAFRNEAHENAIPTFFARLMGVLSVGVAATAIAEAKDANATDCLKPLAIPDRWDEMYPAPPVPWPTDSHFDRWNPDTGVLLPVPQWDSYIAPDQLGPGTGLSIDNFGQQVTLEAGTSAGPIADIRPWRYLPVQIPGSQFGANQVYDNTHACARSMVTFRKVADTRLELVPGGSAANAGSIAAALADLVNVADPGAHWNTAMQRVEGSCAQAPEPCASISPRVIAIPTYDPLDLALAAHGAGATSVVVTNVVGFFVESVAGTNVTGRITRHPGFRDPEAITLFDASSFLRASMLVQ